MARVNGVPLPQHPSYHVAGLLQELTEEQRQASWADAITTIASINRIEWQQEFQFLVDPAYGPAGLDNYLDWIARSEEHTSELQSLMRTSYAVFCLQKKKTTTHTYKIIKRSTIQ